jgi:histidinol phosphatase-like PHP family hydrolase
MNLDPAGEGDMEAEALERLDIVLGSFHSQLRVTDDQTERYVAGLRNPDVSVLGHPRCRMWDRRVGLRADWERVFSVAAELDKAIETDAHANRQDIDAGLLEVARDCGVRISIGTDAHDGNELDHVDIGLAAALRAGIPKERILNFMPADDLVAWSRSVRR